LKSSRERKASGGRATHRGESSYIEDILPSALHTSSRCRRYLLDISKLDHVENLYLMSGISAFEKLFRPRGVLSLSWLRDAVIFQTNTAILAE
jgi:hypothetical protein